MSEFKFDRIEDAIEDIRQGKMVIVIDDEDRENEGDLVAAAEKVTPEMVNFMVTYGRGLICVPMTQDRLRQLRLPQMTEHNTEPMRTAFTISVDDRRVKTGISAFERAQTIRTLSDPASKPEDLVRPGHIFPLRAADGGVLRRAGHTEAAVDLARLAGLDPSGITCEILNDDGTMARTPQLMEFAKRHGLRFITIADLIRYRRRTERLVERMAEAKLPTRFGEFRVIGYKSRIDGEAQLALVKGDVNGAENVLVRMHSGCVTGDILGSLRCDCGEQLHAALAAIEREGLGVLVYFPEHEGRGLGLIHKLRAYALQDEGLDTVEADQRLGKPSDLREYGTGAQILADLGLSTIRLLTNNPKKIVGLEAYGLAVTEQIPLTVPPNPHNERYLLTKQTKMGHKLRLPVDGADGGAAGG